MKRAIFALIATLLLAATLSSAEEGAVPAGGGQRPGGSGVPLIINLAEPPLFLNPKGLSFFVAVGIPYDLFHHSGTYYLHQDNAWYISPFYSGPWEPIPTKKLPKEMKKQPLLKVREMRDKAYREMGRDNDSYRGRFFFPKGEYESFEEDEEDAPLADEGIWIGGGTIPNE